MRIAIVGTGYVGLVTGTCLAETGNTVTCVDIDKAKIESMKSGHVPIYEPDLDIYFNRNTHEGRLNFTDNLAEGIKEAEVIFLALPTPPNEDGSADLTYMLDVADRIGPILSRYTVIVDKSTVPVGTAERIARHIKKHAKVDFDVVSNPEFLREGFAVKDFMKPDRVVIGTSSSKARKIMNEIYRPLLRQGNPIFFMDERSAEMTKYSANSFLALKISFINEIANLCEKVGADVDAVRLGIGSDERIGKRFLFPGIGYGGSCFPKDVLALDNIANHYDYDFKLLEAIKEVNAKQKQRLINKVLSYYHDNVEGKKFALWGLAFKPDTDDIREAPSIEIIKDLIIRGAEIIAYDPVAINNVKKLLGSDKRIHYVEDEYKALIDADALLIATEWSEFRSPDFSKIKKLLKQPVIFDGRNLYDIEDIEKEGFYYNSIGRRVVGVERN